MQTLQYNYYSLTESSLIQIQKLEYTLDLFVLKFFPKGKEMVLTHVLL